MTPFKGQHFQNAIILLAVSWYWGLRANGTKTYAKEVIHCLD